MLTMAMKAKTTAEALHEFGNYATKQDIFNQQKKAIDIIAGPIYSCREKIKAVNSSEAENILREIGYSSAMDGIKGNILEIFDEEVLKATNILKEVQSSINQLKSMFRTICENYSAEPETSDVIRDCCGNCRDIIRHFELRNKILKHCLMAPADMMLNKDPFAQVPDFVNEDDRIIYYLCKLVAVR